MRRALTRAAIFTKTAKIWTIRQVREKRVRMAHARAAIFAEIANIVKSTKIWKIRQVSEKQVRRAPARVAIFANPQARFENSSTLRFFARTRKIVNFAAACKPGPK